MSRTFLINAAYYKMKTYGDMFMAEYFGNICTCRKCNGIVHTIRRGDTLYLLSRYYNVTINEIMRANANVNIYNLQIGDQICIPVKRPMPTTPNRPSPMPNQNQQRPPMVQPRNEENNRTDNLDDLIEDLLDANDNRQRMQSENMMESSTDTESMQVDAQVMDESSSDTMEASAPCCGSMRVKDILKNENMTLEELAKLLKDM